MKKGLILAKVSIIAVAMMFTFVLNCSAAAVYSNGDFYQLGDANTDKTIDIRDLVRIKKLAGNLEVNSAADINSDGNVDATDLSLLKRYFLGDNSALDITFEWDNNIK